MIALIIAFALGLIVGLIHKGIHIHVNNSNMPKQDGYNESLANLLPAEVQNYYQSTHGQNRF
jgi:cytochrome bd-type quinol oxidase subunit 2